MNIIKVLHQVIYLVSKEIIMLDCSFGIQLPKLPNTIAIITFNVLYNATKGDNIFSQLNQWRERLV